MILVTGTGRCGTGFISQLLTSAGVYCTHEGLFNLNGFEWTRKKIEERRKGPLPISESSWMAAPHIWRPECDTATVVHLVRNPYLVIASLMRMDFFSGGYLPYSSFAHHHIPMLEHISDPLEKSAWFYLQMNWMIERRADFFHRIEDDPIILLDELGLSHDRKELFCNTRYNHRDGNGEEVNFNDLPEGIHTRIQEMGERYGYQGDHHDA